MLDSSEFVVIAFMGHLLIKMNLFYKNLLEDNIRSRYLSCLVLKEKGLYHFVAKIVSIISKNHLQVLQECVVALPIWKNVKKIVDVERKKLIAGITRRMLLNPILYQNLAENLITFFVQYVIILGLRD
jgi:hypothetical protein